MNIAKFLLIVSVVVGIFLYFQRMPHIAPAWQKDLVRESPPQSQDHIEKLIPKISWGEKSALIQKNIFRPTLSANHPHWEIQNFVVELFLVIRGTTPSDVDLEERVNRLLQSATREGMIRSLFYDSQYEKLVATKLKISSPLNQWIRTLFKNFFQISFSQKTSSQQDSLFQIRRQFVETTLEASHLLEHEKKWTVFYGLLSSFLAEESSIYLNETPKYNSLRTQVDHAKHQRWCHDVGFDLCQGELIIKLLLVFNGLSKTQEVL